MVMTGEHEEEEEQQDQEEAAKMSVTSAGRRVTGPGIARLVVTPGESEAMEVAPASRAEKKVTKNETAQKVDQVALTGVGVDVVVVVALAGVVVVTAKR